jgi:DNA-binding response OmpR family regulator
MARGHDSGARVKLLVVDDDELMRYLLETVGVASGHEVIAAENGRAALDAYARHHPDFVVLDWEMPEMDGLEACRQIRVTDGGRNVFILIVTARDAHEDLASVLDAGADDYVSKPASIEHLRARFVIAERRIQLDRARRAAEEALARARWLAGIGETTLALEHEINNPLAALLGHAALLEMGGATPEEDREHIDVVVEQAKRIGTVVKRLAKLKEPTSVEYLRGARMLDLSPGTEEEGR